MNFFDFVFIPRLPDEGLSDSVIRTYLEQSLPDISAYELLRQSFWDTWSGLFLPDHLVNPLDIWPHTFEGCETCQLWDFLVNDILTSALISFRNRLPTPQINLAELIEKSCLTGSYSDYVRNIKQRIPSIINPLFNITQEKSNGPYQIQTAYPNLVAAIIAGVGKSPLSQKQKTRNSLSQNLSFSQICLENIAYPENVSSYPAEELYIFERLFSIEAKMCLFHMAQKGKQYPQSLLNLVRHMPNVFSRLIFAQALFDFPEPNHSIDEENFASGWLKVIGGYIFPVWQVLFCMRLIMKHHNNAEPIKEIVRDIESLAFYKPQEIKLLMMQDYIDKKLLYTRSEKEQYSIFIEPWDVNWWAPIPEIISGFTGSTAAPKAGALQMTPLMDYSFLSGCLVYTHS